MLVYIITLSLTLTVVTGLDFTAYYPNGAKCELNFKKAFQYGIGDPKNEGSWVCPEKNWPTPPYVYPGTEIAALLKTEKYATIREELKGVHSCVDYMDGYATELSGQDQNYHWTSMCKLKRTRVYLVWAKDGQGVSRPCVVLDGQYLYQGECIHPWIGDSKKKRVARIFTKAKRHMCLYGDYGYDKNFICKPASYISQAVYVYCPHHHSIFKTVITDIPMACDCAECKCNTFP